MSKDTNIPNEEEEVRGNLFSWKFSLFSFFVILTTLIASIILGDPPEKVQGPENKIEEVDSLKHKKYQMKNKK